MQKQGINPITIRPLETHPGNAATLSRMHVEGLPGAEGRLKMFSIVCHGFNPVSVYATCVPRPLKRVM